MNRIGRHTIIEEGVIIGDNDVFIGNNVTIRRGSIIGNGVVIGHNVVIEEFCIIEEETRIQAQVYLAKGTQVGRKVFIGPQVCTTNDKRILSHGRGRFIPNPPIIKDYVRIGASVLILPGVVIEENALIGAGSKVTKDVKAGEMWYGGEATYQGRVPEEELING